MNLVRRDPSPKKDEWPDDHLQREFLIERDDDWVVDGDEAKIRVDFIRFGRGTEHKSDFYVEITWMDVRSFVREFIAMEHSEAVQLQRLMQLAQAIEGAGWHDSEPPPEDFLEIMPQSD